MPRKPKPKPGRTPRAGLAAGPVTIRATAEERARWQDAADRRGVSLSELVRDSVERAI